MRDLAAPTVCTGAGHPTDVGADSSRAPTLDEIRDFQRRLSLDATDRDDAARIDRIRALEQLHCTTQAAQAEATADFTLSQRAAASGRGVRTERRDRGLGSQIALSRRETPHRGQQHLALAMMLRTELPHTRAAFRAGRLDEWKTTLIVRETACLSLEHRMAVDEAVAGDAAVLEGYSVGELLGHLARLAAKLDPAAVAERRRRAEADRHTSLRPAPDTMTWFSALLTVKDGVGVQATLDREARRLRSLGDERGLGQIRADLLVRWILGRGLVDQAAPGAGEAADRSSHLPVMVNLVVPDAVLLGEDTGPDTGPDTGWVDGYGPVPGDLLRDWIADRLDEQPDHPGDGDITAWIRRVYADPGGRLTAMDSRAELFNGRLAEFLRLRDRRCRTPWCDAPIRHLDHVVARAENGPTTADNGQGLCEHCNHAKQADGWQARPRPGPRHTVETTTPTGHAYVSVAPAATG